jgi:5-methylthioadenosine/S-adenosylhomocysteine deaminase
MMKADFLIKNGTVLTMDMNDRLIMDGAVAVGEGKILAVGKTEELSKVYTAEKILEAKGKLIMPGLINTHTHLFQVLMRSLGDDMSLFDWWSKIVAPLSCRLREEHCYYAALVGSLELLKGGCTCSVDNHYAFPVPSLADDCIKALVDVGIRGIEAMGTMDSEKEYEQVPPELKMDTDHAIEENVRLIRDWNNKANGRIQVWFGTDAPPTCSDELLQRAHDLSKQYNVGMCCHVQESQGDVINWKKETGLTPIQYYDKKIDFLDSNLLAVHCVWLDAEDIRILARKHVKVSHNPVSNMYLANGIAPIPALLQSGVTVGLGVDGAASNNNQDMFEVIKTTALVHKAVSHDPTAITAEKVLKMATIDGAKALGLEKEIGSLEPQKKADIILINLKEVNMVPLNNLVSQLVYCGKSHNVQTVMVDGEVIMEDRTVKTIDETPTVEKTQELASGLVQGKERIRCS